MFDPQVKIAHCKNIDNFVKSEVEVHKLAHVAVEHLFAFNLFLKVAVFIRDYSIDWLVNKVLENGILEFQKEKVVEFLMVNQTKFAYLVNSNDLLEGPLVLW